MHDRSFLWGGRSPFIHRSTGSGERRRHDQQRLLVELELDDLLDQRVGMEQSRILGSAGDTRRSRQLHPSNYGSVVAGSQLQLRNSQSTTTKSHTKHQMHQLDARRLSSFNKPMQHVRRTEQSLTLPRYQSTQRPTRRSMPKQSPAHLVIESIRQNIQLRDQVMAHLQQEVLGGMTLQRALHVNSNVPQRMVKLLNRIRSLSLAVVEAVVYLSSELKSFDMATTSYVHDTLEQDFYGYLLQMASCDWDFLMGSPQLQRLFQHLQVHLTRNPFLDGLSLSSSELLLCSCHQSMSSSDLFCSASSLSSSLLGLLTQKLETFALQTQQFLADWQIFPAERVAAALLHLMDLETRFNALQMLPRYLQSHSSHREYLQHFTQMELTQDDSPYGSDTYEGKRVQRRDTHSLHEDDGTHLSVVEAWAGSPVAKNTELSEPRPSFSSKLTPQSSCRGNDTDRVKKASFATKLPISVRSNISSDSDVKSLPKAARESALVSQIELLQPTPHVAEKEEMDTSDLPSSPRIQLPNPDTVRRDSNRKTLVLPKTSNLGLRQLVLPLPSLDVMGSTKISSRSSERSVYLKDGSEKSMRIDAESQLSGRNLADEATARTIEKSANTSFDYDEVGEQNGEAFVPVVKHTNTPEVELAIGSMETTKALEVFGSIESARKSSPGPLGISHVYADKRSKSLVSAVETLVEDTQVACSVDHITTTSNEDEYACNFEYSSEAALSGIAMVLQMLPDFSFSASMSPPIVDQVKCEEDLRCSEGRNGQSCRSKEQESVLIDSAVMINARALPSIANVDSILTPKTTSLIVGGRMIKKDEYKSEEAEQKLDLLKPEYDEYAYSSGSGVPNDAVTIKLLPSVSKDDVFSIKDYKAEDRPETCSSRMTTYQSIAFKVENEWPKTSVEVAADALTENHFSGTLVFPSQSNASGPIAQASCHSDATTTNSVVAFSTPTSSFSANHAALSCVSDDAFDIKRVFALCRDIQGSAIDMSQWVSRREVEDHIHSAVQPYSSLVDYSSPSSFNTNNALKFLERELKMVRRNFVIWKEWVIGHQREKLLVRESVARRKVRHFVSLHHRRRLQARIEEENGRQCLAALRIQRNWKVYSSNKNVAYRRAVFFTLYLAFHRALFFVKISKLRRQREDAKEKVVRWWRHEKVRIKKKRLHREKGMRERERRARARKDIYHFLKEVVLRRKLKTTQDLANKVLFRKKLKWTNAKREMEKKMKLDYKHRIDLIADMDAQCAALDRQWKASELERLNLLTHHERFVYQQQQAVEVRRRRLAALKIQMFYRICLFHAKLARAELAKKQYARRLHKELLTKVIRDATRQKQNTETRAQVRALEQKIDQMTQVAIHTDTQHRHVLRNYQERDRRSRERAARQRIKAFLASWTLVRRANCERRKFLHDQAQLQAKTTEMEQMLCEDQREQRRTALSIASELEQRLSETKARSDILLAANAQLAAEKEENARQAVKALESSRTEARLNQIASWGSKQLQLSKLHKERDAIRALAALEMDEEKKKLCKEIDAKTREISMVKATSVMYRHISQKRSHKRVEMMRTQHEQKTALKKALDDRNRALVVQLILDFKFMTERASYSGITQGLHGLAHLCKVQAQTFARLKQLRSENCARTIQRVWRQWRHQQRIKSQELAVARARESKLRHVFAQRIQGWWRKRVCEQQRRREQQSAFEAHLKAFRVQAGVRKISHVWRRWQFERQQERRRQQHMRNKRLLAIRVRVNARKLQRAWRRWLWIREKMRHAHQKALNVLQLASVMRQSANARKIQVVWRRWIQDERARRHVEVLAHTAQVNMICIQANAHKIQKAWRHWVQVERDRRLLQQRAFEEHVEAIRFQSHLRKIQRESRRWIDRKKKLKERQCAHRRVFINIVRLQRWWRRWRRKLRVKATRTRIMHNACAQVLQRMWRRWHRMRVAKRALQQVLRNRNACACKVQRRWRQWRYWRQRRNDSAKRIQKRYNEWQKIKRRQKTEQIAYKKIEQLRHCSALKVQTCWRIVRLQKNKQLETERVEDRQSASSLPMQQDWGTGLYKQDIAVVELQTLWRKWHFQLQEKYKRECIRDESCRKIQRTWKASRQQRKIARERLHNQQNLSALKILRSWRRSRYRCPARSIKCNDIVFEQRQLSMATEPQADKEHESGSPVRLKFITQQIQGRRIARAVDRYLQSQRAAKAATNIKNFWKKTLFKRLSLQLLEQKRAEEARQYQLKLSVLAAKVQACWRHWHTRFRQAKRAAVIKEELYLIQKAKALERKLAAAKRTLAAKQIQRYLASRRRSIAIKSVSNRKVVLNSEKNIDKEDFNLSKEPLHELAEGQADQIQTEECGSDNESQTIVTEEDSDRASVNLIVEDWSHRHLPHILSRSVNQILFCHEAAIVIQKCVRSYRRRRQLQFYFQYDCGGTSPNSDTNANGEHFYFYLKKARAWLALGVPTSGGSGYVSKERMAVLCLRFDSQMTRKLLQLFEPNDRYSLSEILTVLRAILVDAVPIFQSPVCLEDNDNSKPELRYHVVGELELPQFVVQFQKVRQDHALIRRQQHLEIDINSEILPLSLDGAPLSPSQDAKKEVTVFSAIEMASVEDAMSLQQRGADLWALEAKTQRNALHLLSFSKGSFRSRTKVLEFFLSCGTLLNVNAADCNGDTPLMLYASLGHLDHMQKLLQHGADIHLTNKNGQNVLHRACENDQVEICGFLQQLMLKDENVLADETISSLVPTALSLHTPDKTGRYPFHYLAENGCIECVKQLMVHTEANRDWNRVVQAQKDSDGRTALHLAVQAHDVAMTTLLLTADGVTDVNAFDHLHQSPLHYAIDSPAALQLISCLVQRGALVNVADERGDTPLHMLSGRAAVTRTLLSLGADPTLCNSDWETPAQIAAAYGQLDCMRLLLHAQQQFSAVSSIEQNLQQSSTPFSDDPGMLKVEETVNHRQATIRSNDCDALDDKLNITSIIDQAHESYWEELHQDMQLVEESGQFSSDDE